MASAKLVSPFPMLTIVGLEITLNNQYDRFRSLSVLPENATSVLSNDTINRSEIV